MARVLAFTRPVGEHVAALLVTPILLCLLGLALIFAYARAFSASVFERSWLRCR